jgi:hypothetical protein
MRTVMITTKLFLCKLICSLNFKLFCVYSKIQTKNFDYTNQQKKNGLLYLKPGADWPYNEVGKIPRGPSRLGAPKAIGGPPAS